MIAKMIYILAQLTNTSPRYAVATLQIITALLYFVIMLYCIKVDKHNPLILIIGIASVSWLLMSETEYKCDMEDTYVCRR